MFAEVAVVLSPKNRWSFDFFEKANDFCDITV